MRVVAVVDTRNMRGLAAATLGFAKSPTVAGLDACTGALGFTVERSFFSVALPRRRDRRHMPRELQQNTSYIERLTKDPRVSILQGELHRHDGQTEEKLADVLCAVEVIRQAKRISEGKVNAEAVLLFSQDADLTGGIDLAQEFDVPVLVASPGKIFDRGHPYLILTERMMAQLCGVTGATGQELRSLVARAAASPQIDSWEYRYPTATRGMQTAMMRHRHGFEGLVDLGTISGLARGDLADLAPTGIVRTYSTEFPRLTLGATPVRSADLEEARVIGRFRQFRATVELADSSQVEIVIPNSHLTPGTHVLVQHGRPNSATHRYVGALDDPPPLTAAGMTTPATAVIARITAVKRQNAMGETREGLPVFIPSTGGAVRVGSWYLVNLAGSPRGSGGAFVAHLASSALPRNY